MGAGGGSESIGMVSRTAPEGILEAGGGMWPILGAMTGPAGRQRDALWPEMAVQGLFLDVFLDPFSIKNAIKNQSPNQHRKKTRKNMKHLCKNKATNQKKSNTITNVILLVDFAKTQILPR